MPLPLLIDTRQWSRETRLLVVTIVVSLGVLLVLARFRIPAQQPLALTGLHVLVGPVLLRAALARAGEIGAAEPADQELSPAGESARPALDPR